MSNPIEMHNGEASWVQVAGDQYLATGKDRNGKRFRIMSRLWSYIDGLNLWNGTKWLIRNGKKYKIKSIKN